MTRFPMKPAIAGLVLAALAACATTGPVGAGADGVLEFQGTVDGIDNGCFADGVCSVVVDGQEVVTMRGWSRATWGSRDPEIEVGDRVAVRCVREDDGCTLEGSSGYYLRKAK